MDGVCVVSITCRGGICGSNELVAASKCVLNVSSRWAKQSSLSTSAPCFLLYCAYSPIYSFKWYLPFSPLLFLSPPIAYSDYRDSIRHPSDCLDTCCQVSIAPISQPSLSHLVFPNNPRILLQVHPPKRTTNRLRRLQTRQGTSFVPLRYANAMLTYIHRPITTRMSSGNCYSPFPPPASRQS